MIEVRERALRLKHQSDYNNHVPCNSLDLLAYCFEKPDVGINCLNKAKILAECCLALGIYARRRGGMPCSPYDGDNHADCPDQGAAISHRFYGTVG